MAAPRTQTVRQRRLGAELRRLREQSNLTGDDVAAELAWSAAKVSRIETAKSSAALGDVSKLLALYGINGTRYGELMALAEDARRLGWWKDFNDLNPDSDYAEFIGMEDEADTALQWETATIPGLLQSEAYARAIIEGWNTISMPPPSEIDNIIKVRIRRQMVLTRPNPLTLQIVLDESALLRRYGTAEIMRAQMLQLLEYTELDNVQLRVLPLNGPHPIVAEPFILLQFAQVHDVTFPDIVHTEGLMASHVDNELYTHRFRLAYETLVSHALTVQQSRKLIFSAARDVW